METTLKNQHQRVPLNLECKKIPSLLGFAKRRGASGDKSQCKPAPAAVSDICLPARGVWYTPVIMVAYYQTHSVHISFIIFCHFGPIVFSRWVVQEPLYLSAIILNLFAPLLIGALNGHFYPPIMNLDLASQIFANFRIFLNSVKANNSIWRPLREAPGQVRRHTYFWKSNSKWVGEPA